MGYNFIILLCPDYALLYLNNDSGILDARGRIDDRFYYGVALEMIPLVQCSPQLLLDTLAEATFGS